MTLLASFSPNSTPPIKKSVTRGDSTNMWRGCLHSHWQRAKVFKAPQIAIYDGFEKWVRVDMETPFNFIADGNRFLVLRSTGVGPATQATAQPRHHISHTGFSPNALGGMCVWVGGEGGGREGGGASPNQHLSPNCCGNCPPKPATLPSWRKSCTNGGPLEALRARTPVAHGASGDIDASCATHARTRTSMQSPPPGLSPQASRLQARAPRAFRPGGGSAPQLRRGRARSAPHRLSPASLR